ncbi:MAG: hypothetical protein HY238_09655 [Acidobacteria bacterium]|nr:hypothetical protein [Acidobacteriota bacterium]
MLENLPARLGRRFHFEIRSHDQEQIDIFRGLLGSYETSPDKDALELAGCHGEGYKLPDPFAEPLASGRRTSESTEELGFGTGVDSFREIAIEVEIRDHPCDLKRTYLYRVKHAALTSLPAGLP